MLVRISGPDPEVLVGEVFVVGVAATRFGRGSRSTAELTYGAATAAMADAGLAESEIPAVFAGCSGTGSVPGADALAVRLGLRRSGLGRDGEARVERASDSAPEALQRAWQAVELGLHDVALCVGAERLPAGTTAMSDPLDASWDRVRADRIGAARHYMARSGATVEHLARVTAKNRGNGARNPKAGLGAEVPLRAVLDGESVGWPLTRLMIAPRCEGAAAIVLASAAARRRIAGRGPRMRACALVSADKEPEATTGAARLAYRTAGLGPEDVDFAEVHDATAVAELVAYESLQFAPVGYGPELIDAGFTSLGGVLPVNTSGGLLTLGELAGATGIAQLCELSLQLRGEAGVRQVAGARVGLAQCSAPARAGTHFVSLTVLSAN